MTQQERKTEDLSAVQIAVRVTISIIAAGMVFFVASRFPELGCLAFLFATLMFACGILFLLVVPSIARNQRHLNAEIERYREEFGPHFMDGW